MSISGHCQPPSSSLPPVRSLRSATEDQITSALHNLQALYCPLRLPVTLTRGKQSAPATAHADSGYVSEDEEVTDEGVSDTEEALAALRADEFERTLAVGWLTTLIARADELPFASEDSQSRIIDEAASILASFSDFADHEADEALTRDFSFPVSAALGEEKPIQARLNDAPLSGTDHTDVGLQSWGASIILSGLLCIAPGRFGLHRLPKDASIIELGAGTGLVSLTLGQLMPRLSLTQPSILATDYHPAVLENLRANITTNFGCQPDSSAPVKTMLLDWSAPPASLHSTASMLVAADVVYAPEHAAWLRDCAADLLAPDGVFWLVVTVRKDGKFEGIPGTAEAAFADGKCPKRGDGHVLRIVEKEMLEKRRGVGRGDESGYMLFKIMWE
ncbi:hypothetical protein BU26DRAFT_44579 [Trematosphaeria pertusa]|uniref:S-adenosyl-L-methionine-dependent methyltransferase n=1 Tax=Trematosphaeria pertusa TaxID=390896 RepID=A0A6A6I850_9PLEO|nr:uncharacterized protein BU26DRAFT_44579 [Trematosphaeria pertusa]KAF2246389.1 hypothetical protein BU26DRAFT_44579 [Trematosphaeria pertusa]